LRGLILNASAGDTITLPAGCTITLTAAGGPIVLSKTVTLVGAGASRTVLDGGGVTGVVAVNAPGVSISDLTGRNGSTSGSGGGISVSDAGSLTLARVHITGNRAVRAGGGLSNSGSTVLIDSTISGNTSMFLGGGIVHIGGSMSVLNTTISGTPG